MGYLPVFLNVEARDCLVVGAGPVACRRVRALVEAGARAAVVALDISPELSAMADRTAWADRISIAKRPYRTEDMEGRALAFACADDPEVQRAVVADAHAARVPVARADDREGADFIAAAHFRRGPVCVAVGTSGAGPALAARLLARLEGIVGSHYGVAARVCEQVRSQVPPVAEGGRGRSEAMARLLDGGLVEMLEAGRAEEAARLVSEVTGLTVDVAALMAAATSRISEREV